MLETGLGIRGKIREETLINPLTNEKTVQMGDMIFPPRKVFFKTFGCQMNYHDTERMLSHLSRLNFTSSQQWEEADMVLFNTCAIRDLANSKFYSHLGVLKEYKKRKNNMVIGVGGCVAQVEAKQLLKRFPQLDFAFGTDAIDQINDFVFRAYAGEKKFFVNKWDRSSNFSIETKIVSDSPKAYINIIKGCNKYCSYCIVPYTRGKERSRTIKEVVDDVRRLVDFQGVQEVTLLGQNVNSFGHENGESLSQLIIQLDKIESLQLIRYTTSHPYDMSDELIAVHGNVNKLSRHVHLPVQSGSNTVLMRMLREYTIEHYLKLCEKLRKARSSIALSTDIIVGFPGETQEEYQATLDLLKHAQYDFIYAYVFSPRSGTRAEKMPCSLTKETKKRRLHQVQKIQLGIQKEIRSTIVGKTYRVLVEDRNQKQKSDKWWGRTSCNRIVHFNSPSNTENYRWKWVDLKITSATALSCQGQLVC